MNRRPLEKGELLVPQIRNEMTKQQKQKGVFNKQYPKTRNQRKCQKPKPIEERTKQKIKKCENAFFTKGKENTVKGERPNLDSRPYNACITLNDKRYKASKK